MECNKITYDISGNSFSKSERICHKKVIEELFKKGSSNFLYPFLIRYKTSELKELDHHRILISVPKKHFKKAVHRNLIKRRIKEIYRTNKSLVYPSNEAYDIAIVYIGKESLPFKAIKNKLIKALKRLPIKS